MGNPTNSSRTLFRASLVALLWILATVDDDVRAEPITITEWTLNHCRTGTLNGGFAQCCPPKPVRGPVVDFKPHHDPSKPLRIRKALQCLQGEELQAYLQKLARGYALMRALPYSDPRSLARQADLHCMYGTGSLPQNPDSNLTIDVHWNWLFLPFHRMFVYFHERILQKLLGDDLFSLVFWNFDSGPPVSPGCACSELGHFFPGEAYGDPRLPTFDANRSSRARERGRIVDLSWESVGSNGLSPVLPAIPDHPPELQVLRNKEVLRRSIVDEPDAAGFFSRPFRVGDAVPSANGSSLFELNPHGSVHVWVGALGLASVARDPVFYPFHANVERLWAVWRGLDPGRRDPAEADWLDASFLLWDEEAVLRRVWVRDLVDTEPLGYQYEKVNDANWISFEGS